MDKDLNKCGCGDSCGCNHDHHEEHQCGCGHDHDHDCGCGDDALDTMVIDLEDDNGNIVSCPIIDAFEYEEKEYLLASSPEDDSVYLFRVDGEELTVPEEAEFDVVAKYYNEVLVNQEAE